MARKVTVNADNVVLPDGNTYNTGDVVNLTQEQYNELDSGAKALLTDGGYVADADDAVVAQAADVAAIANPSTATATDCANKINEILTALKASGGPMA